MDETYAILILGEPVPSARPRMVKGHTYLPKRTMSAIKEITFQAKSLPPVPCGTIVEIDITFYCAEKRNKALANLEKTVLDGLHPHPLIDDNINIVRLLVARCEFVTYLPATLVILKYKQENVIKYTVKSGVNMARVITQQLGKTSINGDYNDKA